MMERCLDLGFLKTTAHKTVSCARPNQEARWRRKNLRKEGEKIPIHCGYCTPCIIRRAAMSRIGIDDKDDYVVDVLNNPLSNKEEKKRDLRAFLIALEKMRSIKTPLLFSILESGPIPGEEEVLKRYVSVYKDGMIEVDKFLAQQL